ncbi:homoserine dehydrogenase [candidate division KSB1 bacterium]|nr:homoserine dehydrogenase [candidate division KSB1 bacterium]
MKVNCILAGFGNVGSALGRLLHERTNLLTQKYDIDLVCCAVIASKGAVISNVGLPLDVIVKFVESGNRLDTHPQFGQKGLTVLDALNKFEPGVLFESTLTNIKDGEPGLTHFNKAIENGWHIVTANKGPLVVKMAELKKAAKKAGTKIKVSGATAAALPTTDVGLTCLAGSTISKFEGIVTGTANFLLTRMAETGKPYDEALKEAQAKGMAETDPSLDVEGWDTANKTIILANSLMDCDLKLDDLSIEGITGLDPAYVKKTKDEGKEIKLLGVAENGKDGVKAYVKPVVVDSSHPLYGVNGTNKGINFTTDTMGEITVTGGRAGPVGTSAAMLKDLINIYRE